MFSPRIRQLTCEKKLSGEGWIEVAKTAHRHGLRTNATLLYGHIETIDERLEHLDILRRTQDETGGFLAYIPLAFHPKNTEMADFSRTTAVEDLKNIAVARLMLDNFPHTKAYWVMIGPKLAQVALSFGADDMDGTVKSAHEHLLLSTLVTLRWRHLPEHLTRVIDKPLLRLLGAPALLRLPRGGVRLLRSCG